MIKEFDPVVLTEAMPEGGLEVGDIGWVVMVHGDHEGYEVEFVTLSGASVTVATLPSGAVRSVDPREIAHARRVA